MALVKNLIQNKPKIWTFAPEEPTLRAIQLMAEKKIGAVLIMEAEKVVGIFSERDFSRRAAANPNLSVNTPLQELMTPNVFYVSPEQSVDDCMALMTEKKIRHLPVIENHRLVGIISIGDVVRAFMNEKESDIKTLEDYIWVNMM